MGTAADALWSLAERMGQVPRPFDALPPVILRAATAYLDDGPCWRCGEDDGRPLVVFAGYVGRWHFGCWTPPTTCTRCGAPAADGAVFWGVAGRTNVLGALCATCEEGDGRAVS